MSVLRQCNAEETLSVVHKKSRRSHRRTARPDYAAPLEIKPEEPRTDRSVFLEDLIVEHSLPGLQITPDRDGLLFLNHARLLETVYGLRTNPIGVTDRTSDQSLFRGCSQLESLFCTGRIQNLARRRRENVFSVVTVQLCTFPCLNLQQLVHFSKVECSCT